MTLNDESTWCTELVAYLQQHHQLFLSWELLPRHNGPLNAEARRAARSIAANYDDAIDGLKRVLDGHVLHGYHCTRLTAPEIDRIASHGMQSPNGRVLNERLTVVKDSGLVRDDIADRLRTENSAADEHRAGTIWFCFYPPHLAGQDGIERFFRSWGGEALYRHHEDDPVTGPVLKGIGTPCLVEAEVPIIGLGNQSSLSIHLYRQFLVNRGHQTVECVHHEGHSTRPIASSNVRRIIRFPERDFTTLTHCNKWRPRLA